MFELPGPGEAIMDGIIIVLVLLSPRLRTLGDIVGGAIGLTQKSDQP